LPPARPEIYHLALNLNYSTRIAMERFVVLPCLQQEQASPDAARGPRRYRQAKAHAEAQGSGGPCPGRATSIGTRIGDEGGIEPCCLRRDVEKHLSQMMFFVGNDGYGGNKKSVNAYRNRLSFYLRFRADSGSRTRGLEITIICWNLLAGCASRQNKREGDQRPLRVQHFRHPRHLCPESRHYGSCQENPA
jgi:hypothetical protein